MDKHNKIDYVEFPARELDATKAFFNKTFGWSFEDYGPDYSSFTNAGLAGGFILQNRAAMNLQFGQNSTGE